MRTKVFILHLALFATISLSACHSFKKNGPLGDPGQTRMHSAYDDSTLTNKELPVMMPYNRLIDPAGKVIRFGDPRFENHSLDLKLIPQSPVLVVEDRYGITMIDTTKSRVIAKWAYNDDLKYSGLMSTYSGIKTWISGNETYIFWSAANKDRSYVMQARWDGKKISIQNALSFKPLAPSPMALPNELVIHTENYKDYLYVVLNGNNQVVKMSLDSQKTIWTKPTGVAPYGIALIGKQIFITNWGGPAPTDTTGGKTAGVHLY
jgi:hypothetical protein